MVDVTAEFLAQLTFTAIGAVILLIKVPDSTLARPLEIGLFVAVAAAIGFIVAPAGCGAAVRTHQRTHRRAPAGRGAGPPGGRAAGDDARSTAGRCAWHSAGRCT